MRAVVIVFVAAAVACLAAAFLWHPSAKWASAALFGAAAVLAASAGAAASPNVLTTGEEEPPLQWSIDKWIGSRLQPAYWEDWAYPIDVTYANNMGTDTLQVYAAKSALQALGSYLYPSSPVPAASEAERSFAWSQLIRFYDPDGFREAQPQPEDYVVKRARFGPNMQRASGPSSFGRPVSVSTVPFGGSSARNARADVRRK